MVYEMMDAELNYCNHFTLDVKLLFYILKFMQ